MTQEDLDAAVEQVREAAEAAHEDRPAEELGRIADDLEELGWSHDMPDQSRLRGHRHTLREFHGEVNEDARDHLSKALDHVASMEEQAGVGSGSH